MAVIDVAAQQESQEQHEPAARVDARKMFKYSDYLHVGEGAGECAVALWLNTPAGEREGELPVCSNTEHFHAWVRLPNPYQHDDIRKKATAAKARVLRAYRDPESDASVVLDERMHELADPAFRDSLVDELVARDWADNFLEAQRNVEEREEFEHIAQDREEFARLERTQGELPDEERSEEFRQIEKHLAAYAEAIRLEQQKVEAPKREELGSRAQESLVDLVRGRRVEEEADRVFMDVYHAWMWFVGTFHVEKHPTLGRPHVAMWDEIGAADRPAAGTMYGESPEVLETLRETFNALNFALRRASAGN